MKPRDWGALVVTGVVVAICAVEVRVGCPGDVEAEDPSPQATEDMFESLTAAAHAGQTWCLNPEGQCYHSHRNRSYDIYLTWKDWIDEDAGGFPGLMLAGSIRTESEGNPFGKTKSHTRECGLASIDIRTSEALDIEVPERFKPVLGEYGYVQTETPKSTREKIDKILELLEKKA